MDIFGVTNIEEVLGFSLFDDPNIPDDARELLLNGEIARYETVFDFEKVKDLGLYKTSKSGIACIYVIISPLYLDGSKSPNNYIVQVQDITEREKAEEERQRLAHELANRVAELQAVLDAAPVAIWIAHDPQCQRITGNAYADQMLRAPRNGNISRSALPGEAAVSFRVFHKDVELWPEELPAQIAAATGKPVNGVEQELVFPDGRHVHLLAGAVPLFDNEGHIRGSVSAGIDVTQLKLAEEELRKSKNELKVINEKLQAELEHHQKLEVELIKAKDTAETASKAKAFFMANMSHELRTPMNAVIGFTNLLLDEKLTAEQKDYVESIRMGGESLMALINDVLDFSRMEREKTELEIQPFDLRTLTEEALDLVAAKAAEKGIELIYTFSRTAPEAIIGDPGKLRQVLGNLLSNAVKFTSDGEVEVNVSSYPEGNEVHVAVRDTGIGIPQEDTGKLFQPFSQGDMSLKRGYEGTGLGLAISKKLIDLMGGKIWVESEVGKGSTFHFTIPAETAPSDYKLFLADNFNGKRVLIAVENQTLRRILGRQVHAWGMIPRMAESPQEINELLQWDKDFDVVIIDASKDDTVSLMAETCGRWKDMPFIALTSLGQRVPSDIFQAVLTKPFKPAKLFRALQDVLEKSEASELVEVPEMEKRYGHLRILLAEDNHSNQKVTLQMLNKLGLQG